MTIIRKLISGDETHKTRFHDHKENLIDFAGLKYLPHCLSSTFLRLTIGKRPVLPWIGYRAIRRLKNILNNNTRMLEFGSGMSTVWYAKHCREVISVEDNEQWYKKISEDLTKRKISNVKYKLKQIPEYFQLAEIEDKSIDFIMIDGSERAQCVTASIPKLKAHGYIYLDNSDKSADDPNGDLRVAERLLLKAVEEQKGTVEYFVDFMPTYFGVTQGMLVQLQRI